MNSSISKIYARVKESLTNITFKRAAILLFRLVIGVVFLVDGFKIISDPVGRAIYTESVLSDSFLSVFEPLSLVLSILAGAFKVSVGCCMLLGTNILVASVYLIIFLFIEFFVLLFLPLSTGWLLVRNLSLILISVLIILLRKHSVKIYTRRTEWIIELYSFAFSIAFALYSFINLPIVDRTAMREGSAMKRVFLAVAMRSNIEVEQVNSVMNHVADEGYSFVLLSRRLTDASTMLNEEVNNLYSYSQKHNYPFVCLTGEETTDDEIREYVIESKGAEYPILRFNKSLIDKVARSNPEFLILKDGNIVRKFSAYKVPKLDSELSDDLYGHESESYTPRTLALCVLAYFIPLLLLLAYDYLIELIKWLLKKIMMKTKKI